MLQRPTIDSARQQQDPRSQMASAGRKRPAPGNPERTGKKKGPAAAVRTVSLNAEAGANEGLPAFLVQQHSPEGYEGGSGRTGAALSHPDSARSATAHHSSTMTCAAVAARHTPPQLAHQQPPAVLAGSAPGMAAWPQVAPELEQHGGPHARPAPSCLPQAGPHGASPEAATGLDPGMCGGTGVGMDIAAAAQASVVRACQRGCTQVR